MTEPIDEAYAPDPHIATSSPAEDKWYADLELLIEAQEKEKAARKRLTILAAFVVAAFLLLSWRSEVNGNRIDSNSRQIIETQRITCESGLEILRKFNTQQDALIAIERANLAADASVRNARIKAYEDGRIDPLPICEEQR